MYLDSLIAISHALAVPLGQAEGGNATEVAGKIFAKAFALEQAASGSWRGKHASVYYKDLQPAPAGASYLYFRQIPNPLTGITALAPFNEPQYYSSASTRSSENWTTFSRDQIRNHILEKGDEEKLRALSSIAHECERLFAEHRDRILSQLRLCARQFNDQSLSDLSESVDWLHIRTESDIIDTAKSKHENPSIKSNRVADNEERIPPHIEVYAHAKWIHDSIATLKRLAGVLEIAIEHLTGLQSLSAVTELEAAPRGHKIFIGHGRSSAWKKLRSHLEDILELTVDEFNQSSAAGMLTFDRLQEMVTDAAIAFLVLTGEDKLENGKLHPRLNVVHEAGLFQCKLGNERAILLLEQGCEKFSNIDGITYISFPKERIQDSFPEIERVLKREGLLTPDG
ncbi:MAG: nucleotide-binding protein [Chloroflexota bacterium]|nr:nucleotide-binding protein [Chloroflexota bacterium]